MESKPLREQIAAMRQSFFDEGILDEQFTQLEQLESKDNPNFVEEVLTLYFRDSSTMLATMEQTMDAVPVDFPTVERVLHKLKGCCVSIGASKVLIEINKMRELCQERNVEGAKAAFKELQKEQDTLKAKLEPYFQQLRQAGPSEAAMPPK
ncbi:hypothetical protein PTKIN_Ptkin19aG0066000 [Pterospermum kingtungense]